MTRKFGFYYGYASVSKSQELFEEQLKNFNYYANNKQITFTNIICETVSSLKTNKIQLDMLLTSVQEGDTFVVNSYSKIARSVPHMIKIVEALKKKHVNFVSLQEQIDLTTSSGLLMYYAHKLYAELNYSFIREEQAEGIRLAKLAGKYKGRVPIKKPNNFNECFYKYINSTCLNKYTFQQFMLDTNLKKTTLRNFINASKKNIL